MRKVAPKEVLAEISATSYKELVKRLQPLNKRELWEVFDHYLCHVIEDKHVTELLEIFDQGKEVSAALRDTPEDNISVFDNLEEQPSKRLTKVHQEDTLTEQDLAAGQNYLLFLFDFTYFQRLTAGAKHTAALKLFNHSTENDLPIAAHWENYSSATVADIAKEEEERNESDFS